MVVSLDSIGNPILDADERRFFGLRNSEKKYFYLCISAKICVLFNLTGWNRLYGSSIQGKGSTTVKALVA
jgi:hypothetical protein